MARTSENEFIILLPKTSSKQANKIVKRINNLINQELGFNPLAQQEQALRSEFKPENSTLENIDNLLYQMNTREEKEAKKVGRLCKAVGEALELPLSSRELETAGLLRNIGYISIEEKILNKPVPITPGEWKEIRCHPELGAGILQFLSGYENLAEYVRCHHERWDGQGYPRGLKGEEIPLPARIIAVTDAYTALTCRRPY